MPRNARLAWQPVQSETNDFLQAAHLIRKCLLSSIIGALAFLAAAYLAKGAGEEKVFGSMFHDASSFVFQHDGFDVKA